MSEKIQPPMEPGDADEVSEAARVFIEALLPSARRYDPRFDEADYQSQRGMLLAIAVQALGNRRTHPEPIGFGVLHRALGMAFGSFLTQLPEAGREAAITFFNGGATYALTHTLADAKPEGEC